MGNACSAKAKVSGKPGAGTLIISDSACLTNAKTGQTDARMQALIDHLVWVVENDGGFSGKVFTADVRADEKLVGLKKDLARVHDKAFVAEACDALKEALRTSADAKIRVSDKAVFRASQIPALFAAPHVALRAVDALLVPTNKQSRNVLCLTRPSGHRAGPLGGPKGYGLFNNALVAAAYARAHYKLERIAIVDADPHVADGSLALAKQHGFFFASTHLTEDAPADLVAPKKKKTAGGAIVRSLPWDCDSDRFRRTYSEIMLPALRRYKPQLVLFCIGFPDSDSDPNFVGGSWHVEPDDLYWLAGQIAEIAGGSAMARVITLVEDGAHTDSVLDYTTMVLYALVGLPPPEAVVIVQETLVEPARIESEDAPREPTPPPQPPPAEPSEDTPPPPPPKPVARRRRGSSDDDAWLDPEHTFLDQEIAKQWEARRQLQAQLAAMEAAAEEGDAHERQVLQRVEQLEAQLEAERDTLKPMQDALAPHVRGVEATIVDMDARVGRAQDLRDAIDRNQAASLKMRALIQTLELRLHDEDGARALALREVRDREAALMARTKTQIAEIKKGNAVVQLQTDEALFAAGLLGQQMQGVEGLLRQCRVHLAGVDDEILSVYDDVHTRADYNDDHAAVRRMRDRALFICKDSHANLLDKKAATGADALAACEALVAAAVRDAAAASAVAPLQSVNASVADLTRQAPHMAARRHADAASAAADQARPVDPAIVRLEQQVQAQQARLDADEAALYGARADALSPSSQMHLDELARLRRDITAGAGAPPPAKPRSPSVLTEFSPQHDMFAY